MRNRKLILASIVAFAAMAPVPAHAAHHLWRIQQLYSNADGSVQFIELETTSAGRTGETNVGPFTVVAGGNTFSFGTNAVPGASGVTQWLLLATSNFASLPGGVAPDYIIPPNFFPTGGGTITYAAAVDTFNYGTVPTDGFHSLTRDISTLVADSRPNAPINIAGTAGQLGTAPTPAATSWSLALAVGALLLAGSGLLGRRRLRTA
jgi:hypothetical protein